MRHATQIARFDAQAMLRVASDRRSLFYGAAVVAVAGIAFQVARGPTSAMFIREAVIAAILQPVSSALTVAIVHGAAKLFLGATGSYVALLRVLWLGSIVQWLAIVPIVGVLVGGIWFLILTLVAFEEIDGIERLQALFLVVGVGR